MCVCVCVCACVRACVCVRVVCMWLEYTNVVIFYIVHLQIYLTTLEFFTTVCSHCTVSVGL